MGQEEERGGGEVQQVSNERGRGEEVGGTEAEGGGSKIKRQRRSCEKDEGGDREEEEGGQGKTGKVKKSTESAARQPYWHCPAMTRNCLKKMPLYTSLKPNFLCYFYA